MAQDRSVTKSEIDRIVADAQVVKLREPAEAVTLAVPDFCAVYKGSVRPIIMVIIGFLKIINQAWAEAVASVVVFVDKLCA